MSATATEPEFAATGYDLPIPGIDGRKATRLEVRFAGAGELDWTSEDDLALLEAGRLGVEVRLLVVGRVSGKSFRLSGRPDDGELSFACTVKVARVEAAEIA
ncbi:MAG TPA: hypothetical protein VNJ53_02945 [Gaiellaceae bacterium]|nr:hypothetical protein [Gaiellaceae bacterium]